MNSQINLSNSLLQDLATDRRTARLKRWWEALKGNDDSQWPTAMRKLEKMEDPRLINVFADLLDHKAPEVQQWALKNIARMKRMELSKKTFSSMVKLTKSKDLHTRELGLKALVALDMPALTAPHIEKVLLNVKNADPEQEKLLIAGISALAESGDPTGEKILRKMAAGSRFAAVRREIQEGLRAFN